MSTGDFCAGRCYCGAVRFAVSGEPRFCVHCHCPDCRRAHAAAFVTWAGFRRQQVRLISGQPELSCFATPTGATRSFCRQCGTPLFYEGPRWPDEIHVALAALDDAGALRPKAHVYVDDRAPWHTIADDLPHYGGKSGTESKAQG